MKNSTKYLIFYMLTVCFCAILHKLSGASLGALLLVSSFSYTLGFFHQIFYVFHRYFMIVVELPEGEKVDVFIETQGAHYTQEELRTSLKEQLKRESSFTVLNIVEFKSRNDFWKAQDRGLREVHSEMERDYEWIKNMIFSEENRSEEQKQVIQNLIKTFSQKWSYNLEDQWKSYDEALQRKFKEKFNS